MLNNPLPVFDFFKEGFNVSVPEILSSIIIFCAKRSDYDDKIKFIFNVFDADGGGTLDRKEASKLLTCTIYGLSKLAGLPSPNKMLVSEYVVDMFKYIDADGSGQVEYDELKDYVD